MSRSRSALALLALAALFASGCPNNGTPNGGYVPSYPPTARNNAGSPGPTGSLPPGTGVYSDAGIEILGGSLTVSVTDSKGARVNGATLLLYGPTMATTTVDASGKATFGPLAAGTGYRLIVTAAGLASQQIDNIEIKKKSDTSQPVTLAPEAVLSGRVTTGGAPAPAVVVSDGLNSALTDAQGGYTLHGVAAGQVTLTAAKSRFQTATRAIAVSGQGATGQDLMLAAGQSVVYFDASVPPGIDQNRFTLLQNTLRAQGWQIATSPPDREGIWVLLCPSKALPTAVQSRIVSFVAQGGKLIVFGAWGGFGGFNNPGVNGLTHAVGLHFNPDLVRDPAVNASHPEWLNITSFQPSNAALQNVSSIKLYAACSLFGLPQMATWAQTSSTGYRVQDNAVAGPQRMIMAGPFKGGKAIAVGNASGFSDEDTEGSGTPNIKQANNLELAVQLFNW